MDFNLGNDNVHSEPVNKWLTPEKGDKIRPIKTQSAAVARATASICSAERADFDVPSGCEGFFYRLSALACLGLDVPAEDLPLLQRMWKRQQGFLRGEIRQLPAQTEPAVVFKPVA